MFEIWPRSRLLSGASSRPDSLWTADLCPTSWPGSTPKPSPRLIRDRMEASSWKRRRALRDDMSVLTWRSVGQKSGCRRRGLLVAIELERRDLTGELGTSGGLIVGGMAGLVSRGASAARVARSGAGPGSGSRPRRVTGAAGSARDSFCWASTPARFAGRSSRSWTKSRSRRKPATRRWSRGSTSWSGTLRSGGSLEDLGKRFRDAGISVESAIGFFDWIVDDPERRRKGLEAARGAWIWSAGSAASGWPPRRSGRPTGR